MGQEQQVAGASATPSGSREPDPSCTGSGPSGFDPSRGDISNAAKCIVGGWFSKMRPGKGELTFSLGESKPRQWVADALVELIAANIIEVRPYNEYGGLVFTPKVDCHEGFVWMMKGGSKTPEAGLPLTEPIKSPQDARNFQRKFLAIAIEAATAGETCNRLDPKGEGAGRRHRPEPSQKDSPDV